MLDIIFSRLLKTRKDPTTVTYCETYNIVYYPQTQCWVYEKDYEKVFFANDDNITTYESKIYFWLFSLPIKLFH